jgi:hypothetical protein
MTSGSRIHEVFRPRQCDTPANHGSIADTDAASTFAMLRTAIIACLALAPAPALAWGNEGHEIIAAIARDHLTPAARAKVDAILASDPDALTAPDMLSRATWADVYRNTHRETASWHYVNIELDHPDIKAACYGFPMADGPKSQGPADDCVVSKIEEFSAELADPSTAPAERAMALKFLLHFVGDLHQPLHSADNHDRGGNCVLLALGGPRTTNLHAYWDTTVVQELGDDPRAVAAALERRITPAEARAWRRGDPRSWLLEGYAIAKTKVYTIGSPPGCGTDVAPIRLPAGYDAEARRVAAVQLEKAGVRLAALLNQ